jgi:hypothetical protein
VDSDAKCDTLGRPDSPRNDRIFPPSPPPSAAFRDAKVALGSKRCGVALGLGIQAYLGWFWAIAARSLAERIIPDKTEGQDGGSSREAPRKKAARGPPIAACLRVQIARPPPTLRSKQLSLKLRRLVHVSFVSIFASGGARARTAKEAEAPAGIAAHEPRGGSRCPPGERQILCALRIIFAMAGG